MSDSIQLGNFTIAPATAENQRHSLLIWGMTGCGKTTLAATAPGKKLWLQFDPDALTSLIHLPVNQDILQLDLSGQKHAITERLKDDNPFGLERVLTDRPDIETVVFDSITTYSSMALENAVHHVGQRTTKGVKPSIEAPGLAGYGHRNALTLRAVTSIMRLCKRTGKHFIGIAHEASPEKDDDGNVLYITLMLGGTMASSIGVTLSEVWWMSEIESGKDAGKRKIALRPVRSRKPMKSRMFDATCGEFIWNFNPNTWEGEGLADWFQQWTNAKGKIKPPGS